MNALRLVTLRQERHGGADTANPLAPLGGALTRLLV